MVYWIIFTFILIAIIGLTLLVIRDFLEWDDFTPLILAPIFLAFVLWAYIEFQDYDTNPPTLIDKLEISVLCDDNICILIYEDFQNTYKSKKQHDAITSGNFNLEETIPFNIQGEDLVPEYKLIIE